MHPESAVFSGTSLRWEGCHIQAGGFTGGNQEMSETKLLPCPFCGGNKIRIDDDGGVMLGDYTADTFWAFCRDCWSTASPEKTRKEAIAAWNKRTKIKEE
jgi:Lar family restriction alleviation protein